jgi:hypothetical protein
LFEIDLNTTVIENNARAYMVHPGKGYHLFAPFLGHGAIAPDLPEIEVGDKVKPSDVKNFDLQIKRARALRDWLGLNDSIRRKTSYSTKLTDYSESEIRRYHNSYIESADLILWGLPEGSVVFVPNPDLAGQGFFCELESNTKERKLFPGVGKAIHFNYLGRRIRNIKRIPMRLVPPEILESKTRQAVVTELNDEFSQRVFRLYYGSFSIKQGVTQVEIDIASDVFRPVDAVTLSVVANLFEDNLQKFERGESSGTDLMDALFKTFDEAELQLHARLNSPGVVQIAAKSVTPIVFSALFCLTGSLSAQEIADEAATRAQHNTTTGLSVKIKNTKCPEDDEYPRLIEDRLFGILNMMGEKEIILVCDRIEQFKTRTGATTDAKVE